MNTIEALKPSTTIKEAFKGFEERVVEIAKSFVGQQEIRGNRGWNDKKFQKYMEACGWATSQAWCSYFVELVYKLAIEPDFEKWKDNQAVQYLNKLHSAGAVKTFKNFAGTEFFEVSKTPKPGSLICFQYYVNGNPTWQGHIGINTLQQYQFVRTVEGNTNDSGGREGIEVANMRRALDFDIPKTGKKLVLLGFVNLKSL